MKKEKFQRFEEIIEEALSKVSTVKNPEFVHMLGIPASGKTSYYKTNQEKYKNYVFIEFVLIMMSYEGYQNDVKLYGSVEAFRRWEIPVRVAGYELLRRAVNLKKNVFFDHGGTPKCHQELLRNVKSLGYITKMIYIYCDIDVAIKRVKAREIETQRHTPEQMIRDRMVLVEKNKHIYKDIVDMFEEL